MHTWRILLHSGDHGDTHSRHVDASFSALADLVAIQHLSLTLPGRIDPNIFLPHDQTVFNSAEVNDPPVLETLNLPDAYVTDTTALAGALSTFTHLRSLDVSRTSITGMIPIFDQYLADRPLR